MDSLLGDHDSCKVDSFSAKLELAWLKLHVVFFALGEECSRHSFEGWKIFAVGCYIVNNSYATFVVVVPEVLMVQDLRKCGPQKILGDPAPLRENLEHIFTPVSQKTGEISPLWAFL